MAELKQVILVRKDLKMSKGKLAAQVSHASVNAMLKVRKKDIEEWQEQGMKKVVLSVKDIEEIKEYKKKASEADLPNTIIRDAGRTELEPGTITCLGIGPADQEKVDAVTGGLKML